MFAATNNPYITHLNGNS